MIASGFEKVAEVFSRQLYQQKLHPAAQLVVHHKNAKVVDLAGSLPESSLKIDEENPFLLFSISKCFTAAAILQLMDEGLIELDAPIASYWPEFAQGGKEPATIRHALLHQAGIPSPHLKRQLLLWSNWEKVTRNVAQEKALYKPGTQTAYHLVNFGFILGEVVRRVTGQPIDQYLERHFFNPMGLTHTKMQSTHEDLIRSPKIMAVSADMRTNAWIFNLPIIRKSLLPAASVRSSARDIAEFFIMLLNNGNYQGNAYLKPETVNLALQSHYDGFDYGMKNNMNWGLGFIVGGGTHQVQDPRQRILGYASSETTFAGFGMGTCMAWADKRTQTVTTFTCNGMLGLPAVDERWAEISNAVWDCIDHSK